MRGVAAWRSALIWPSAISANAIVRSCSSAYSAIANPRMRAFCPQVCTRTVEWPRRVPAGTVGEGNESAVNLDRLRRNISLQERLSGSDKEPLSGLKRHRAQQEGGQVAAVGFLSVLGLRLGLGSLRLGLGALRLGLGVPRMLFAGACRLLVRTGLRLALAAVAAVTPAAMAALEIGRASCRE